MRLWSFLTSSCYRWLSDTKNTLVPCIIIYYIQNKIQYYLLVKKSRYLWKKNNNKLCREKKIHLVRQNFCHTNRRPGVWRQQRRQFNSTGRIASRRGPSGALYDSTTLATLLMATTYNYVPLVLSTAIRLEVHIARYTHYILVSL